jgi:Ca2+-transporting ATPase
VPGDIVEFESGDIVTADMRALEVSRVQADEAALTGESAPVAKQVAAVESAAALSERSSMLFKGTAVTRGSGRAVVVAVGMDTELGEIAAMTAEAEAQETPLEKRLDRLGYKLIWLTLAIAALVALIGFLAGKELILLVETAIALAVAAIPEGLPVVATIALARGLWRMLKHNALMNRLSAVETLGATTVICTDKTGTLTEGRMAVSEICLASGGADAIEQIEVDADGSAAFHRDGTPVDPAEHALLRHILAAGVLCNNAELGEGTEENEGSEVGDPMEIALQKIGREAGIDRGDLLENRPERREEAFDRSVRMMATFHQDDGQFLVAVKGAPEAVLDACGAEQAGDRAGELDRDARDRWLERNRRMAEKGLRVLAIASKTVDDKEAEPYEDLVLLGLIGMQDPPRGEVAAALEGCRRAGIDVVMVTGDQPVTADQIAVQIGLVKEEERSRVLEGEVLERSGDLSDEDRHRQIEAKVFARVSPKQKLGLIEMHQENGDVVAMTGDGVNDAPALKKADIGIAMGRRGTQVAQEAADMVLKDDAFNTIVVAIEQGRAIFDNIRNFILFLLSGNVGEIMIVAFAIVAGAPLPILPLQILYLNMIGDVFPALALAMGRGDCRNMREPPRDPGEPILTRRYWLAIGGYGLLIALSVLAAFALALTIFDFDRGQAVTVAFLSLSFGRLWHVFNMRAAASGPLRNEITSNPYVWGALALGSALLLLATYVPTLAQILSLAPPDANGWLLILGFSLVPLAVGQGIIEWRRNLSKR